MVSYSPWLMVSNQYRPEDHHHSTSSGEVEEKHMKLSFLNVSTSEICTLQLPMDAYLKGKTVCGFSLGWLILSDKQNSSLTLLNPFSGNVFNLPGLPRKGTVHKAILTADPSRNRYDFRVLTIFGDQRELIGYEQEHEQWTMLQDYGPHYK